MHANLSMLTCSQSYFSRSYAAGGGASLEKTLLRFLLDVLLVALFLQRLADLLGVVLVR